MRRLKTWMMCLTSVCLLSTGALAQGSPTVMSLTKETLAAQAKKEGKVVWYTTPGMAAMIKQSLDEWKRLYPDIAVEIVEGAGAELAERVRTERRASRPVADLVNLGDGLAFQFTAENGYQPLNLSLIPNSDKVSPILKKIADPQNRYLPLWVNAYGIIVNKQIVAPEDMPKKWSDLLSPKYARKLVIQDFSRFGGAFSWVNVAEPVLGEKYFRDLVAQEPRVFGRSQEVFAAVARGDRAIGAPGSTFTAVQYDSSLLQLIFPEDGAYFIAIDIGIVVNAPHPAAATLFLDHLLSVGTQTEFASKYQGPVRDDVPSKDLALSNAKFLGAGFARPEDLSKMQGYLDMAAKILRQ